MECAGGRSQREPERTAITCWGKNSPMKSARTLGGRGWVALFACTLGATLPAACVPVERPEKVSETISSAEAARDAGAATAAQPTTVVDPGTGEGLPGSIEVGTESAADQAAAAACADATNSCSSLGDAGVGETCPGCFIEGSCYAVDTPEPGNPCRICNPLKSPLAWSNNDGAACDDGAYCTDPDTCSAGSCVGNERACEDGVECNGTSTCNEVTDSCSTPVSQCGTNALCDAATDTCVSTCDGCILEGVCIAAGSELPGNPCRVCDPEASTTAYSVAIGKSCGAAATACSGQDTCNAQGQCAPNHLPANTPCGNANASGCDQADACDGVGNCQQRAAQNGSGCNDGQACTVGDQCQAGQCVATGRRNCGPNSVCNEASGQCQCQGCQIGSSCVAANSANPQNPCQVCNPAVNPTAFSINAGAPCGSTANAECSAPDTCNAQGQCAANNRDGAPCASQPGGTCSAGSCVPARQENGTPCTVASQCQSGFCRPWFEDLDGDSHGNNAIREMLCSPNPANDEIAAQASGQRIPVLVANGRRLSGIGDDCCDAIQSAAGSVFPGNTNLFTIGQSICGTGSLAEFDYDCDGRLTDQTQGSTSSTACGGRCDETLWVGQPPPCGQLGLVQQCTLSGGSCMLSTPSNNLRACR